MVPLLAGVGPSPRGNVGRHNQYTRRIVDLFLAPNHRLLHQFSITTANAAPSGPLPAVGESRHQSSPTTDAGLFDKTEYIGPKHVSCRHLRASYMPLATSYHAYISMPGSLRRGRVINLLRCFDCFYTRAQLSCMTPNAPVDQPTRARFTGAVDKPHDIRQGS